MIYLFGTIKAYNFAAEKDGALFLPHVKMTIMRTINAMILGIMISFLLPPVAGSDKVCR